MQSTRKNNQLKTNMVLRSTILHKKLHKEQCRFRKNHSTLNDLLTRMNVTQPK